MKLQGRSVVITGAGRGIGRALAERFAAEGVRGIAVADLDLEPAEKVAARVGGIPIQCDAGDPDSLEAVVRPAEAAYGGIDVFCSNAGIQGTQLAPPDSLDATLEEWNRTWSVNTLAHVVAARLVIPSMLERGSGYFLQTVSAAALTAASGALYATTKFAALGFAEWMALTYWDRGIRVSCLCPTAVDTPMLQGSSVDRERLGLIMSAEQVADHVVAGMERETFLILPNPAVGGSFRKKGQDYDAWLERSRQRLAGMRSAVS